VTGSLSSSTSLLLNYAADASLLITSSSSSTRKVRLSGTPGRARDGGETSGEVRECPSVICLLEAEMAWSWARVQIHGFFSLI
jgi:hypothetical protein